MNGLKYEPQRWNGYEIRSTTNCYAYALNLTKNILKGKHFSDWDDIQPNNICNRNDGKRITYYKEHNLNPKKFIESVYEDCKYIGYQIRKSSFKEKRQGNWWKVALCFSDGDYHWYRLNDNGTWSHKMSSCKVSNRDHEDKIITNPETCNRNDYTNFIGYFLIRKGEKTDGEV